MHANDKHNFREMVVKASKESGVPANQIAAAYYAQNGRKTLKEALPSSVPKPYNAIFTAAGKKFDVPPALVAAVFYGGEHGNSFPNPSKGWASSGAGAEGPMQFMPPTWAEYGVDGNHDGKKDVQNLTDAIFGAARMLGANGGSLPHPNFQKAIFNYNHAQWYVDNVMNAYHKFDGGNHSGGSSTTEFSGHLKPMHVDDARWDRYKNQDWSDKDKHDLQKSLIVSARVMASEGIGQKHKKATVHILNHFDGVARRTVRHAHKAIGHEHRVIRKLKKEEAGGERVSEKGFAWPVKGEVVAHWGDQRQTHKHAGIDIAAPMGTKIGAAAEGDVVETGYDATGYGNYVVLRHRDGRETLYGHMSKVSVHSGKVKLGEKIGEVGSTGESSGPHLHFNVGKKGATDINGFENTDNPLDFLP
jgi:hypothetical protein